MKELVFFDSAENGHFIDDPLLVVNIVPDFSCLGINLDAVGYGD